MRWRQIELFGALYCFLKTARLSLHMQMSSAQDCGKEAFFLSCRVFSSQVPMLRLVDRNQNLTGLGFDTPFFISFLKVRGYE